MFVYIRMFFQLASVHDFSRNAKHMGEHQFDLMCHTSYDSAPVLQSYKKDISENGKKTYGVGNLVFTIKECLQRKVLKSASATTIHHSTIVCISSH